MNKNTYTNGLIASLIALCLLSCKPQTDSTTATTKPYSADVAENAVIYEANIRQYSPEGTLDAFTKDIPQLKELGVKIIWLMPIYPISKVKRKATPELSIEDIDAPHKFKKYLGSYYAVANYKAVNPNFGTLKDVKELVKTAHENGMYVILDWVPNHTGWDHHWLKEHPEYYTKNKAGEITTPLNSKTGEPYGWTDVADLNYKNKDLWKAMTEAMLFWVKNYNIDGFRCDVASEVPIKFWEYAIPKIKRVKPVFMLAEAQSPELLKSGFDMGYNWEGHHLMNQMAQGKANVSTWDDYMTKIDSVFEQDDIMMNFVTNHDENSWNGTIKERMGEASESMLALTYTMPGMPLIYSGQEYDLNHRLKFFVKDTITRKKGEAWPILAKLGELKNNNPALNGGAHKASYTRISTSNDTNILAFKRTKDNHQVYYIANLSASTQTFTLPLEGTFKNYMANKTLQLAQGQELTFKPWQYWILIR